MIAKLQSYVLSRSCVGSESQPEEDPPDSRWLLRVTDVYGLVPRSSVFVPRPSVLVSSFLSRSSVLVGGRLYYGANTLLSGNLALRCF